jgi:putative DNA primase/helicase
MSLQSAALAYANKFNWKVFPLKPMDKHPRIDDWPTQATTNPIQINKWWAKWPNANIGIACGPSNLVVIDCDVKHDKNGIESWRDLLIEHGFKDDTIIQLTPSGGEHFVFGSNGHGTIRNSTSKLGPGIDVRADGGYIVVAPSSTPEGVYQWDVAAHPSSHPVAMLPDKLAALIRDEERVRKVAPGVGSVIFAGQRNDVLTSLAGSMRRRGMNEESIRAAISAVNRTQCNPPLTEIEVERIAASVSRYEPATVGLTRVFPMTDFGNAERLALRHGSTLRYCHAWGKWITWNGTRWVIDDTDEVIRRTKETIRDIELEADLASSDDIRDSIVKWGKSSESRSKIMAMIDLAQAEDVVPIRPTALDSDPWLLNCNNGIIDLQTGILQPHDSSNMITKLAPVDYLPDSTCPLWLAFLDRIMGGNKEMEGFIQRIIGYTLTGSTREQSIFILYGRGANGKSTMLETVSFLLNDYAARTPTETLLVKRTGAIPNDVARLKGARLVTAVEADEGRRIAEGLIKQMTGGERITARFLYNEIFEFQPEFKIWLATNHKPEIIGTDYAIWRRVKMIPFEVTIPDKEQDKDLLLKLREELPGILNWAVRGCLEWQSVGLNPPEGVLLATKGYQTEMDILAGFIDECCMEEDNVTVTVKAVYQRYLSWATENGEKPMTQREFGIRMRERDFRQRRGTAGIWLWENLSLRDAPTQQGMDLDN